MYIGQLVTFPMHVILSNHIVEGTNSDQVSLSVGYFTICQGNQSLLELHTLINV